MNFSVKSSREMEQYFKQNVRSKEIFFKRQKIKLHVSMWTGMTQDSERYRRRKREKRELQTDILASLRLQCGQFFF